MRDSIPRLSSIAKRFASCKIHFSLHNKTHIQKNGGFMKLYGTLVLVLALASCGSSNNGGGDGSGGGDASTPGASISAQFIDAPVKGLGFARSSSATSRTGLTGDDGRFDCKVGEPVSFFVRDLKIGNAVPCGSKIYIDEISNDRDLVIGAAALIQSFATESGGTLDLSALNSTNVTLSGLSLTTIDQGTIATKITESGLTRTAKTRAEAETHVNQNLPSVRSSKLESQSGRGPENLVFNRVSASGECWANIAATVEFEKVANNRYRFLVDYWAGYTNISDPFSASLNCGSGEQRLGEDGHYECEEDLGINRIVSASTFSAANYEEFDLSVKRGEKVGCLYEDDSYEISRDCTGGTRVNAAEDFNLKITYGYNYSVDISDNRIVLNYRERGVEVDADESSFNSSNNTVRLKSANYDCSYRKTL
jgi:hypothetical protein